MFLPTFLQRLSASLTLLILLMHVLAATPSHAATRVVFVTPDGAGNGTSWNNASDLQAAVQAAVAGDQLWIKAGTYTPSNSLDRSASFELKSGVALYGGFKGNESGVEQRDPAVNITILSGDLSSNDTQSLDPAHTLRADNSYHVVTATGTNNTTLLDGVTITGGNANAGEFPNDAGAGMLNQNSNLTLRSVTFRANSAGFGGGLLNFNSKSVLQSVVFDGNNAAVRGGGLINVDSAVILIDATFTNNTAAYGGGMSNQLSNPTVINSIVRGNAAEIGGGIHNVDSNPTLVNALVSANQAAVTGGGIASDKGGRDTSPGSNPLIINSTIYGNVGGGISSWKSKLTVRNSILWNNTDGQIIDISESTIIVQSSLIHDGYTGGEKIIAADPLFVDADGGDNIAGTADDDFRLQDVSPAIDAGSNTFLPADIVDIDGDADTTEHLPVDLQTNRRITNVVDLGAYETSVVEPEPMRLYLPLIIQ